MKSQFDERLEKYQKLLNPKPQEPHSDDGATPERVTQALVVSLQLPPAEYPDLGRALSGIDLCLSEVDLRGRA